MNVEIFRNFLLWCAVINYGLLIFGVLTITYSKSLSTHLPHIATHLKTAT